MIRRRSSERSAAAQRAPQEAEAGERQHADRYDAAILLPQRAVLGAAALLVAPGAVHEQGEQPQRDEEGAEVIEARGRGDREVEVVRGLSPGDTLITTGIQQVKNDGEVEVEVGIRN